MKRRKIFNITLSVVGILLIIGCLSLQVYDSILEQRTLRVTTTITELSYSTLTTNAIIEYKVDNVEYINSKILLGNQDLAVNDKLKVKIDIHDPSKIINNEHVLIIIPVIIISIIVCFINIPKSLNYVKEYKNKKNLKEKGIYINANISEVFINNQARKYKDHYPYRLRCKYQNPADNQLYVFDSEDTYNNISEIIQKNKCQSVVVYLELGHPENYYVDLNSLLPKLNLIDPIEFMKSSDKPKEEQINEEMTEEKNEESVPDKKDSV